MERKNFAALCAAVLCFWLFALALGTAEGVGLRAVMHPEERAVSADAGEAAEETALPAAAAAPQLSLNCRAAILIEQGSGRVLYEKNADERVPIASITKVMTLLLTFEAIHDGRLTMETPVPVSEHAYHMGGSQIWIEPGEHFTLDEMIKAICVSSANDAAVAVAELVGGSEPAFVEQMNARAAALGMEQTTFRNACGLDAEGHLSTARDVAVMSRTILNTCPEVLHYTGIWTDTLRGGQTQLVNTNKLLRRYEGITGLKAGRVSAFQPVPPGTGSPSSRSSWGHRPVLTASTPPRHCWTTVSGPMRPHPCRSSRSSRSKSRSREARRAASRWITRPCPGRCWWRRGRPPPSTPS